MNASPIEIERKYIVETPDFEILREQRAYSADAIVQTYLTSAANVTHRVRMREGSAGKSYTETVKARIDAMSAYEDEREITAEEYEKKTEDVARGTTPIRKTRHSFEYRGQLFEIDVYPQWRNIAVLETELENREKEVEFPDFLKIVKEVTGDKRYSNAALSRRFPPEAEVLAD